MHFIVGDFFERRNIKAISFTTRSILIGHYIGPLAPLWLSKDTTRAPMQGRLSNWYPVSYLQNWICCSLNICCLWGRCNRSLPICVEISMLPNNTWTFGPFNEMWPWKADMFRVWWPMGSSSMQILILGLQITVISLLTSTTPSNKVIARNFPSTRHQGTLLPRPQDIMCRNPTLAKCGGEAQHFQSWGFGILRDSRMFRVRQQGPKHLALRCSWCHWKGLEA